MAATGKTSLALMGRAAQMLVEATTIQKAKELKDLSFTAADYARRKKMGAEVEQHARSYGWQAAQRMGEMLAATKPERAKGVRLNGGTKGKTGGNVVLPPDQPTLADLGLTKRESSEAQLLASLPKDRFQSLLDGQVTLAKVKAEVKKDKKKQERAAKAAAAKRKAKGLAGVHHGDFRELGQSIADESAALIFTDPPYDRGSLGLFDDLGALANRVLVDGGSLVTFCGQYVLPDVLANLSKHLRFFWICCCLHSGTSAQMREYGIKVRWKPMLWFVKGQFRRDRERWIDDLVESSQEKTHHDWQQAEIDAKHFIDVLTDEGELVVDPFCGGGTTAATAKAMGRNFWTSEIDQDSFAIATERISDADVRR